MTMFSESLRAFLRPVVAFLDDESVTEILINGPDDVWVERGGKLLRTEARFTADGLLGAARNVAQFVGRPLGDDRPRLDARLPDGSRIHVVLPPIARSGAVIAIRKFFKGKLEIDALIERQALTKPMARLLEAAIGTKLNVVVSGGTGSGKTTLLNVLSSLVPNDERILVLEDSSELQLGQDHVVSFEARPPDRQGKGEVTLGDLLQSALRLRPDRIVVGEVRGGECFHLIQAMNTGHGGSLSTCHANTPLDTLRRLEALSLMNPVELPLVAVRAQVASAIHLIVCCQRLSDGSRKVTAVSEVLPLNERGEYRVQDLFVFTPLGKSEAGSVLGYHAPTGVVPRFAGRARAHGFTDLDERFFDPAHYQLPPPPQALVTEELKVRWAPSLRHREQGLPDPEPLQQQWLETEKRLRASAPAPTPVPVGARPTQQQPRPAAARRASEEQTQPPTPNPLLAVEVPREEPKVEVSSDLRSDALEQNTDIRTYPPPRPGKPASAAPARPAVPRRPTRGFEAPEAGDAEEENSEKTRIRPMPEKYRR